MDAAIHDPFRVKEPIMMKARLHCLVAVTLLFSTAVSHAADKKSSAKPASARFEISFSKEMSATPLDGHVLLVISNNTDDEPRFQVSFMTARSQQIFGADVDALAPGTPAVIDPSTLGYPAESLNDIPAGDYWAQAVLNIYETFHLGNGRTLKLPPDKGEGQHWQTKPGNLYSKPQKIHFDPKAPQTVTIALTEKNPTVEQDPKLADKLAGWSGAERRACHRRQQVGQAHPHSERSAHQVLGPAHVPGCRDPVARRMGRASGRALPGHRGTGPLSSRSARHPRVSHHAP